jgi:hypothetical protein
LAQGQSLISADGHYKMVIDNNQISLIYCILPYNSGTITTQNGTQITLNYTTQENLDTNHSQLYYFYRINTRGLGGKKFLYEQNPTKNIQNMHYLPSNSNNILSYLNMTPSANAFMITPDIYNQKNYTSVSAQNKDACNKLCGSSVTCDHAFFTTNNLGSGMCFIDNQNNSNPIFSSNNPEPNTHTSGSYSKKTYSITQSCISSSADNTYATDPTAYDYNVNYGIHDSDIQNVTVKYKPMPSPQNRPDLTYYCGLPWYTSDTETINTIYEGFDSNCTNQSCFKKNIQELSPIANYYSSTQDSISQTYNKTRQDLKKFTDLSNNLADPKYKYNEGGSLIPSLYTNDPNPQPNTSILDAQLADMKQNMLVQNTIFTLASVTAVSFILMGILFARE